MADWQRGGVMATTAIACGGGAHAEAQNGTEIGYPKCKKIPPASSASAGIAQVGQKFPNKCRTVAPGLCCAGPGLPPPPPLLPFPFLFRLARPAHCRDRRSAQRLAPRSRAARGRGAAQMDLPRVALARRLLKICQHLAAFSRTWPIRAKIRPMQVDICQILAEVGQN